MPTKVLDSRTTAQLTVSPITPLFGAEIKGIDLRDDDSLIESVAAIRSAVLRYKVVVLRDQHITTARHVQFARLLGQPMPHPLTPPDQPHPEVFHLRNGPQSTPVRGKMADKWHQDGSWRAEPLWLTTLRARIVPPVGGDTLFADMGAAYGGLSPVMKDLADRLTCVHDMSVGYAGRSTLSRGEITDAHPTQKHPVVIVHPETGERLLYANSAFASHIEGLSQEESDWLVSHLCAQATIVDYQCRVRWQPDTIAIWDDWACQHYGVYDYHPEVREMERVAVASDLSFTAVNAVRNN